MTHNVKSSREPVRAICQSNHGNRRLPTTSMSAMKTETWPNVRTSVVSKLRFSAPSGTAFGLPPSHSASGGSNTSTNTITRSSTTSHPTAMRPLTVSRRPRLSRVLRSTTVLATESARPNTRPAARLQPQRAATAMPSKVATGDLDKRAGQRNPAHSQQVVQGKMQPDAEHQQHPADFGE